MVNDDIINFIDDVYIDKDEVIKNIQKYNYNNLFYLIHSEMLYLYFDYVKDVVIHKLYLNDNIDIKNEFNIELTNDLINFYIPNIDVLKTCVLYNYNIDDSTLNSVYNKVKIYKLNNLNNDNSK
ncbi:MAG: hypothetical protein [Vetruanivirus porcinprimi]|uniref:Uncharacterized protein n=1 Tax=phage Lak_Megaphage_RVC_AP1_GC26 TaxID=3109224 RepID=A0ABZ0Z6X6_9CAUD|nr:MAG: hypothetical protein [phage Lak_Megaphage_RVC_AP1_GC26]